MARGAATKSILKLGTCHWALVIGELKRPFVRGAPLGKAGTVSRRLTALFLNAEAQRHGATEPQSKRVAAKERKGRKKKVATG